MKLNEQDVQPLYRQLVRELRNGIQAGTYPEGSKLPTEQELSQKYGVSRITVRNALKELAKENLIISKQGKGTFVGRKKMTRNLSLATSFTQACLDMGRVPGAKVIRVAMEPATEADIEELELDRNAQVVVVERVRFADNVPISVEIDRFPERYAFLLEENLNDASLLELLEKKYHITFHSVHRTIELVYAPPAVARHLGLPNKYPLLFVDSAGTDSMSGSRGQRSLQYIVGDKFKFYL